MDNKRVTELQSQTLEHQANFIDSPIQAGILNQLLRDQLAPSLPVQVEQSSVTSSPSQQQSLISTANAAISEILKNAPFERALLHDKLSELFYQQKAIYQAADIDPALRKLQFITHCGLIMSPDNCITTQLDDLRVRAFVRGIDQAITDKLTDKSDSEQRPLHIVYPACGPFAPLLMPLLSHYKSQHKYTAQQLQVTLIDLQQGAVESLAELVEAMDVGGYIHDIQCLDAISWQPDLMGVDIVVLEAMQHGLSREAQFGIARHFARLLGPKGCLVPQKITVTAALNRSQREFVEQWQGAKYLSSAEMNQTIKAERTVLGEIFSLTAQSLLELPERILDENTTLIECGKVSIPTLPQNNDEQTLLLCSQIQVYGDEYLDEYDSGITHPLPDQQVCINFSPREDRPGDLLLKSGDGIQFFYRMNGLPGFLATWCEGEIAQTGVLSHD